MSVDTSHFKMSKKIELAHSLCALDEHNNEIVSSIINDIDLLPIERVTHEFSLQEITQLCQIYHSLKSASSKNFTNVALVRYLNDPVKTLSIFNDSENNNLDPFKPQIIKGLKQALKKSGLQSLSEKGEELSSLNKDDYPFKPDMVFGYKGGKKLAIFVCN